MNKCIITFGRINPIHLGHGILFNKVEDISTELNADFRIYLSTTQDPKKNPLPPNLKQYYTSNFYPNIKDVLSTESNVINIMQDLDSQYSDIIFVCGSDRINSFKKALDSANGKLYNFDSIEVIQAGIERECSKYSSTAMRSYALGGDYKSFSTFLPGKDVYLKEQLFEDVQRYMRDGYNGSKRK